MKASVTKIGKRETRGKEARQKAQGTVIQGRQAIDAQRQQTLQTLNNNDCRQMMYFQL